MLQRIKSDINKKDIVNHIKKLLGLPFSEIEKITEDVIDVVSEQLRDNKEINIKNFGKFILRLKKAREGRNPKTQEKFTISERFSISFKTSVRLKSKITE